MVCRLAELIYVKHGFAFKGEYFSNAPTLYQLTTPGNFAVGGGFQTGKGKYYSGPIPEDYILCSGDVIVTMTDLSKAADTLGYAAVVPKTNGTIWLHNQRVGLIEIKPNAPVNLAYIQYLMRSNDYRHWVVSSATGSTVKHTSPGRICEFECKLPPASDQKEIACVLGALDDRITLLGETNVTLEALAQALFKSWFVDFDPVHAKQQGHEPEGMDPETAALFSDSLEESELGLVPKGWKVGNVGQIAEIIDCLHAKKPELLGEGWPFLQLSNIRDDGLLDASKVSYITEVDYKKWISRIEVNQGDCVITNVGRVGAVAQIPAGFKAAMGRNMTAIRPKNEWSYPTYLVELLQSSWMRTEIKRRTDVGTILDALNVRNIPALRCVLAPSEVMISFESTCRPLRAAMEANLERINSLAAIRDTLLPRLISGQLRLPEALDTDA
jgi:type I restriction enzyme S subunit